MSGNSANCIVLHKFHLFKNCECNKKLCQIYTILELFYCIIFSITHKKYNFFIIKQHIFMASQIVYVVIGIAPKFIGQVVSVMRGELADI